MNIIFKNYFYYTKKFIKSTFYLTDLICNKYNIKKENFGYYLMLFHIYLIYNIHYSLYYQDPIINPYYYYYYYTSFLIAMSNLLLRGCVLVKIEKYCFNKKEYIGPSTSLLVPTLKTIGIRNIKHIIYIQNFFAMSFFIFILYVSNQKINSNNILNEIKE
jgi:hypothetical protein